MKARRSVALNRREFMKTSAKAALLLPATALLGARTARAEDKLVTDMPDQAYMVQALQYVNVSEKPGQKCTNCQFYTPGEGGMGKCQLIPVGLVKDGGWCTSFVEKVQ